MTQQTIDVAPLPDNAISEPYQRMSDATRYLCAGAYVDTSFRDRCLREVYYQTRRLTAPSYGFDLVTVLDHCLRARNLAIWRDGSIVLTLAVATYLNWISAATVGAALICLRVTVTAGRLIRDFLGRVRTGSATDTTRSPRRALLLLLGWAAAWIVLIVLMSKIASSAAAALTGAGPMSSGAALLAAPAVLLLPLVFALWRQKRVEDFTVDGSPPIRWNERKSTIAEQQTGNTVVYSNFEPFIGAGEVVSSWGYPQRLVHKPSEGTAAHPFTPAKTEREFTEPPFTANEIVGYVRDQLGELVTETSAERSIPDLTVRDRVFQSAREGGPRSTFTDPEAMAEIIRNPTSPARHYLVCQVVSWGGDIVTTVYIHIAVQGRSLYLEVTSTSLAPCNERYRIVDMDGGTGPRAWLRAAGGAVRSTPRTIVRAPGRLVRSVLDMTGHGFGKSRRRKDYGALKSVREMGTRDKLRNFTQRQDNLKFQRLIESRVFAHVLDFLDEHDVDTSGVRAQRATVLNNSGIFVGGDMTVNGGSVTNQTSESSND